jgi:hypothetical protein
MNCRTNTHSWRLALVSSLLLLHGFNLFGQNAATGSFPDKATADQDRKESYLTVHRLMETALVNLEVKEASLPEIFTFLEEQYAKSNPSTPPIRFILPDPIPPKVLDLSLQAVPLLEVLKIVADLSLTKFRVYKTYVIIRDANDKLAFNEIYDLEDWKLEAKRLFPDLRDERRPLFKAVTLEVTNRAQSQPDFFTDPTWPVKLTTVVAARNGIVPDIHHPSINILEYTPNLENRDDQPNTTVDSAKDIAKRSLPSVFTVLVTRPTGEVISQGSAFLITPKHLITNVHVIDAGKNSDIYVLNSNFDDPIPVVAIPGLNDQADLAVLEVDVHLGTALPLAPNEPEIGETIFAVGTPKGLDGTFSTGIVSGFRDYAGIEHLQISAPISPGSSGGPVLNSLGEVIGVAVSTVESGQNLNFAVPTDYILDLIDTILTE